MLALAFLAVTGVLLIADLKHPLRFYLIFTRHHWRSWLVRGSFILGGYGGVVALYLAAALAGSTEPGRSWAASGLPLAVAAAVYTAYLFAQAKARDMWQSPLLAPHLAVQAALAGARGHAAAAGVAGAGARGDRRRGRPGRGRRGAPAAGGRRDDAAARHRARPAGGCTR